MAQVVGALTDPNPQVAGQGFARLQAAGVAVEVGPGAAASRALNIGFFQPHGAGAARGCGSKPLRRWMGPLPWAMGPANRLPARAARADGHHWRARACAVLTGIGTILADDPQLNVRAVATPRQPQVVVVDSQLRTPLDAKILRAGSACIIYTSVLNIQKTKQLQALGATVIHLPNARGQVDLAAMLADLGQRSINELHVEAGAILNGALLAQGLVDELLLYLRPRCWARAAKAWRHWGHCKI